MTLLFKQQIHTQHKLSFTLHDSTTSFHENSSCSLNCARLRIITTTESSQRKRRETRMRMKRMKKQRTKELLHNRSREIRWQGRNAKKATTGTKFKRTREGRKCWFGNINLNFRWAHTNENKFVVFIYISEIISMFYFFSERRTLKRGVKNTKDEKWLMSNRSQNRNWLKNDNLFENSQLPNDLWMPRNFIMNNLVNNLYSCW